MYIAHTIPHGDDDDTLDPVAAAAAAAGEQPDPKAAEEAARAAAAAVDAGDPFAKGVMAEGGKVAGVEPAAPVVAKTQAELDAEAAAGDEGEDDDGEDPETDPAKVAAQAEADAKAATDKEIADLGITNPKTKERFHAMSAEIRSLKGQTAEIETIKETAQQALTQADSAIQFHGMVERTGASGEQVGNVLGYLYAINSGDPTLMANGLERMEQEMAWLREKLGLPTSTFDPLDDPMNADLKKRLKDSDIDQAVATELASRRIKEKRLADAAAATQTQTQTQEQLRAAVAQAQGDAKALGVELAKRDGLTFKRKMEIITPAIKQITATAPPGEWAKRIRDLYEETPLPKKRKVPLTNMPARPIGAANTGNTARVVATDSTDPFDLGVKQARQAGT